MKRKNLDKTKTSAQPPFVVPDGYFDSLEERIMQRVTPQGTKVIRLWPQLRYLVAAACLVVASVVAFKMLNSEKPLQQHLSDENIAIWSYGLDKTALMAAMLGEDATIPDTCCTAEQEAAIITFLEERDIPIDAIILSMNEN